MKSKVVNYEKLSAFGFVKDGERYIYHCPIVDGQFNLSVYIDENGEISSEVYDIASEELYLLHLVKDATGSFVGRVRDECEKILNQVKENCFDKEEAFFESQTRKIMDYVSKKYGTKPEYLWEKYPDSAVLRRHDSKKWYAILMVISKRKLGIPSDENVEIIDLRHETDTLPAKIDNEKFFFGYHMNKKHWITILLDGSVPTNEIFDYIDKSYILAKK